MERGRLWSTGNSVSIPPHYVGYCVACIRAKHDALPAVQANLGRDHRDLRLRQCSQSRLHVAAAKVLLFLRTRIAHGIEQAASPEHFGSELSPLCAGLQELLHQYGNGHISVTRRRYSCSIPARQQVVRCAADGVNLVPDAYSNARTENEDYRFPFRRNEDLAGM